MAKKLYIFGIGGTGSRVIKALTMLLASGCKLGNDFDTVIPIIIDPDIANGDLGRTKDILRLYQIIRNQIKDPDDFYQQEIKTIHELANNNADINPEYFQFDLHGVNDTRFNEYIGFDTLMDDDKRFIRLLFSDSNLESDLSVGFKGNPNMGSIVLNQFTDSENFETFAQTFNEDDAIFIINSIFGGTGAAGFPLLLKTLRGNAGLINNNLINHSNIGGVTYLPYFALDEQDEVQSTSFKEKAKIALDYYNRTIINENQINTLYFIGNKGNTNYLNYSVGGIEQKNEAHFLEMAGALAIFDFCESPIADNTQIKEFGIEKDTENISFGDLHSANRDKISKPLTKFKLYTDYLDKGGVDKALNVSRWTKSDIKLLIKRSKNSMLDKKYFNSAKYKNEIKEFNRHFEEWLSEMKNNKPKFSPFEDVGWENALNLIKGDEPKGNKSFKVLDIENCKLIDDIMIYESNHKDHTALVKLFSKSTENVLTKSKLLTN
jgi:hypothetical protein